MVENGDTYKRIEIDEDHYQCGCYWYRCPEYGDVLKECPIHKQATLAVGKKFERERKPDNRYTIELADGTKYVGIYVHWSGGACNRSPEYMLDAIRKRRAGGPVVFAEFVKHCLRLRTENCDRGFHGATGEVDLDIREILHITVEPG